MFVNENETFVMKKEQKLRSRDLQLEKKRRKHLLGKVWLDDKKLIITTWHFELVNQHISLTSIVLAVLKPTRSNIRESWNS